MADHVLQGNVHQNIPSPVSKCINIVLATSYPDFEGERACLWNDLVPQLQTYCASLGGQLRIIDPYIGNSAADLTNCAHAVLLLEELIAQSTLNSNGPFFLGMIGDKFGEGLVPAVLRVEEFDNIRRSLVDKGGDVRIVEEWYKLDTNAVPPCYVLLNTFASKKKWRANIRRDLQRALNKGATDAHKEGFINQIDDRAQSRFSASAISHIINSATQHHHNDRILIVLRKIEGTFVPFQGSKLKLSAKGGTEEDDDKPGVFVDSENRDENKQKLTTFKNQLSAGIEKANLVAFSISGKVDGKKTKDKARISFQAWVESKEHEQYMEQFSQQVLHKLKQLIGDALSRQTPMQHYNPEHELAINSEALIHINRAINCRPLNYLGNEDVVAKIKELVMSGHKKEGVITVVGEDCSGKTALLCQITNQTRNWLQTGNTIVITRFVGITFGSMCATELWRDICMQLSVALNVPSQQFHTAQTMKQINEWFNHCLDYLHSNKRPSVVIIIDDVHKLKYPRHLCSQITSPLGSIASHPKVVVLVTCALSSASACIPLAVGHKFDTSSPRTVTMGQLKNSDLLNLVKTKVGNAKRQISTNQEGAIRHCIQSCPNPFACELLAHEASLLASYDTMPPGGSKSVSHAIEKWLVKLELKHQPLVVSTVSCYVEMSNGGLTEVELLDLLSANQKLMDTVSYSQQSKEDSGLKDQNKVVLSRTSSQGEIGLVVTRFSPLLWSALLNDFGPLLHSIIKDGHLVYDWSHEIIGTVVRKKYISSTIDIKTFHSNLAELFNDGLVDVTLTLHTSNNRPTRKETKADENIAKMYASESQDLSYIQANPQALSHHSSGDFTTCTYNYRRLRNLWHHLLNAGNVEQLKLKALCHFPYLMGILQSCGLSHLLSLYERTLLQVLHHDLQMLYCQVLLPALDSIKIDSNQLASEVIGRLRYTRAENSTFLNNVVDEAMAWVDNYTTGALLVPLTCWIKPPRCKQALTLRLKEMVNPGKTVILATLNHQHLLVAGDAKSGVILMYHLSSEILVRTFLGHSERVTSLSLANGGNFFVSTSQDKTARVWDLQQGHCIRNMSPHSDKILTSLMSMDDTLLVTGSADKTVKVSSLQTGRVVRSFDEHTAGVSALQLTEHGEFLITGSGDFVVRVWNFETGVLLNRLGGLMAPVTCLTLTSNDAFLMVACEDETLRVFSLCSATELHELRGHEGKVCSLAASADNCQLFAGCSDGKVYVYDLHNAKCLETFATEASSEITSLQVTKDDWFLMIASGDQVTVCNLMRHSHNRPERAGYIGLSNQSSEVNHVTAISSSPQFKYAACGTKSGVVALWDVEVCQCLWTSIHDPPSWISCLEFSASSSMVFSGSGDGDINVWMMSNGDILKIVQTHTAPISSIVPLLDGIRVVSMDTSSNKFVWPLGSVDDIDDEVDPVAIAGYTDFCIQLPHDDMALKSAENPKEIITGRLVNDQMLVKMRLSHNDLVSCISVSKNGKFIITGTQDKTLKVWQADNGYLTQVLVGHEDVVRCSCVADDLTTVVSAADDCSVIIWNAQKGSAEHTLDIHQKVGSPVTSVAVSLDGVVAFSADTAGWLYCWDTDSGTLLTSFNAHLPILQVMTSSDCHRIVVRLDQCPHLAILCLHNTPASALPPSVTLATGSSRKDSSALSISSVGSGISGKSSSREVRNLGNTSPNVSADPISKPKKIVPDRLSKYNSTVFDKLERNRSRASLLAEATVPRIVHSDSKTLGLVLPPKKANSSVCTVT